MIPSTQLRGYSKCTPTGMGTERPRSWTWKGFSKSKPNCSHLQAVEVLNISITLNVIQPGPHSPLNNCPTHISYVLSTSYKSFIYQSSMYFLPNIYLSQIKFYFISKFKLLYYSYCIYIPYYNLKFWWLLVRLIQERSPPDLFISINSYRKTVPILKIFDLHGKFPRLHWPHNSRPTCNKFVTKIKLNSNTKIDVQIENYTTEKYATWGLFRNACLI